MKMPISAHFKEVSERFDWFKCRPIEILPRPPKGTSLAENTSFGV